ncbi:hypothetical protein C9927_00340 [Pseudidiomarina aestuarii]|uniref:Uncharacterized protein n=1 Tax=Pseudidiomarina aestuarii TaxID=624146 RepID=A0A2T4CT24_9GAMM|nr:hypothetical protein C9988_04000 [Pseudidiomarina aestuarii]PTB87419.1 hypothetical protein C9939_01285 [Pseudidiomarina aestuarii]PTB89501.1 hypothetical protein C9928_03280 [Pseudidiomarina aestuarii]PTB90446.1 hypothetical protein C9927_00340 [Pseudidiomarina aestuarii]
MTRKFNIEIHTNNDYRNYDTEIRETYIEKLIRNKERLVKFLEIMDIYDQLIHSHIESKYTFFKHSIQSQTSRYSSQLFFKQTRS